MKKKLFQKCDVNEVIILSFFNIFCSVIEIFVYCNIFRIGYTIYMNVMFLNKYIKLILGLFIEWNC